MKKYRPQSLPLPSNQADQGKKLCVEEDELVAIKLDAADTIAAAKALLRDRPRWRVEQAAGDLAAQWLRTIDRQAHFPTPDELTATRERIALTAFAAQEISRLIDQDLDEDTDPGADLTDADAGEGELIITAETLTPERISELLEQVGVNLWRPRGWLLSQYGSDQVGDAINWVYEQWHTRVQSMVADGNTTELNKIIGKYLRPDYAAEAITKRANDVRAGRHRGVPASDLLRHTEVGDHRRPADDSGRQEPVRPMSLEGLQPSSDEEGRPEQAKDHNLTWGGAEYRLSAEDAYLHKLLPDQQYNVIQDLIRILITRSETPTITIPAPASGDTAGGAAEKPEGGRVVRVRTRATEEDLVALNLATGELVRDDFRDDPDAGDAGRRPTGYSLREYAAGPGNRSISFYSKHAAQLRTKIKTCLYVADLLCDPSIAALTTDHVTHALNELDASSDADYTALTRAAAALNTTPDTGTRVDDDTYVWAVLDDQVTQAAKAYPLHEIRHDLDTLLADAAPDQLAAVIRGEMGAENPYQAAGMSYDECRRLARLVALRLGRDNPTPTSSAPYTANERATALLDAILDAHDRATTLLTNTTNPDDTGAQVTIHDLVRLYPARDGHPDPYADVRITLCRLAATKTPAADKQLQVAHALLTRARTHPDTAHDQIAALYRALDQHQLDTLLNRHANLIRDHKVRDLLAPVAITTHHTAITDLHAAETRHAERLNTPVAYPSINCVTICPDHTLHRDRVSLLDNITAPLLTTGQ